MAQGYYSLQEAAQFLGMPTDELKQMAQKNQIRSFQDRGTLRFRIPDIQELGRRRGGTSDPELVLAEPKSPKSPPPAEVPRTPQAKAASPDVFSFALDESNDNVDLGEGLLSESPSSSRKGPKSDGKRNSPTPKPGSDSDVRLVAESGMPAIPSAGSDSDVKLVDSNVKIPPPARQSKLGATPPPARASKLGESPPPVRTSKLGELRKSALGPSSPAKPKRPSKLGDPQPADSGVRLVPMDSDSDVKIVGAGSDELNFTPQGQPSAGDSDIRLDRFVPPAARGEDAMMLTEEINLDEEIKKQEAAQKPAPQAKLKPKSKLKFPTSSPFELSQLDLETPAGQAKAKPDSSDFDLTPQASNPDSSDFDLAARNDSSLVLESEGGEDFSLDLPDDSSLTLAADSSDLKGPSSGINLANPVDQGISLEDGETSDMDFELSLDEGSTPKPAPSQAAPDSDSEFELSLDVDDSGQMPAVADSDSEFELTLDDSSGEISAINGPQAKAGGDSGERDIFETDFEVPALDDESGSQVAALDTDLDSSDFDIALDEGEAPSEDESGSQVIALDDEEADDAAATVAAKRGQHKGKGKSKTKVGVVDADPDFADIDVDADEDVAVLEEEPALAGPVREVVREKLIEPAPWGAVPVVFMLPCVLIMFVVALMGFEMVQSSAGHKPPGFLTKTIAELMGQKIK